MFVWRFELGISSQMTKLKQKNIRFHLDQMLGSGSQSLLVWLLLLSFLFVLSISILTWVSGISSHQSFGGLFWDLSMRALTPWEIEASMGSLPYLLVLLLLTLFGIFVLSILISFLSAIIDARVKRIAHGLQPFPFNQHIVIFGWSRRVPPIVEELVAANESESESRVLVISSLDHSSLETIVRRELPNTRNTQVFFRSRKLDSEATFLNANVCGAKRVIVVGDDHQRSKQLERLKVVMRLFNFFDSQEVTGPITLVESDGHKELESLQRASRNRAVAVDIRSLPARLIAETVFQPHLPAIFEEILSFSGSELYLTQTLQELAVEPSSFETIASRVHGGIAIGLQKTGQKTVINPDVGTVCEKSDSLIVLADDDSSIAVTPADATDLVPGYVAEKKMPIVASRHADQIRVLFLGISDSTLPIMRLLRDSNPLYMELVASSECEISEGMRDFLSKFEGRIKIGQLDDISFLNTLNIQTFATVIVTNGCEDNASVADLEIIRSILLLTDRSLYQQTPHLIAELNASDSKDMLAQLVDLDFVVSDKIGSKIFAQYIENPHLIGVIDSLICSGRHRIVIAPLSVPQAQGDVFQSIRDCLEVQGIIIGLRFKRVERGHVVLNPQPDFKLPVDATDIEVVYVQ
jgi:ion channel POLLUX/CASTOR